jgi:hypothetical protein
MSVSGYATMKLKTEKTYTDISLTFRTRWASWLERDEDEDDFVLDSAASGSGSGASVPSPPAAAPSGAYAGHAADGS